MQRELEKGGYSEVKTPQVVGRKLWEDSGHWEKFQEHMFIVEVDEEGSKEKRINALKPMNCPCHIQIYNQGVKSYRDLPFRMSEFGSCHRYEPSGAMHGIMRVRGFVQDDAHIFCTEEQIESETKKFIELLSKIYTDLGFKDYKIKFSDRPEKRAGSDETWFKAEEALKNATYTAGYSFELNPGEGAFYGPKLEFVLTDAIGRDWQCGTLQVDFVLPERLNANYIAMDGNKKNVVMLHRAILGSFERFIGILIEENSGKLPLWLTPTQVVIASVVSGANDYAKEIYQTFLKPDKLIGSQEEIQDYRFSHSYGSTDVGDVSWVVPTAGMRAASWVPGTAAHSWQAVASGGTSIGLKGAELAAKVLAKSAVEIFSDQTIIEQAKIEQRIRVGENFNYKPLLGDRNPPLDYRKVN